MTDCDVQHEFGLRVRESRKKRGLTQEQLAEAVDKSVDTISNIERGFTSTRIKTAAEIASTLGIPFAKRFGLVFAGGILAVKLGILPWKANQVRRAVDVCYLAAYANRPGNTEKNRKKLIRRVCSKLSKMNGLLDFITIKHTDYSEAELQACSGFRVENLDGETCFYVRRKWLKKWCKTEAQISIALEHFEERGLFLPGRGNDQTRQKQIASIKKRQRYYVFTADAANFKRSWKSQRQINILQ